MPERVAEAAVQQPQEKTDESKRPSKAKRDKLEYKLSLLQEGDASSPISRGSR